jgi:hypothetical protein
MCTTARRHCQLHHSGRTITINQCLKAVILLVVLGKLAARWGLADGFQIESVLRRRAAQRRLPAGLADSPELVCDGDPDDGQT